MGGRARKGKGLKGLDKLSAKDGSLIEAGHG